MKSDSGGPRTAALHVSRLILVPGGGRPAGAASGALRNASHEVGVAAEVEAPAVGGGDAVAGAFPVVAVAVEMAVL